MKISKPEVKILVNKKYQDDHRRDKMKTQMNLCYSACKELQGYAREAKVLSVYTHFYRPED